MVQTPWAAALGWTLMHSLWEGALAALALAAAVVLTRSPRLRYAAGGLALLALLAALAVTFQRSLPSHTLQTFAPAIHFRGAPHVVAATESTADPQPSPTPLYLPWLAPLWMAGVCAFQLRALAAWIAARRLRRAGVCAAPALWRVRLEQLARRSRVSRPVLLLESCLAEAPVVIGYLRPAILMPVGLLAGLPAAQVEAILLHELAHIRRHDYLVNLVQTLVEGLLFYHPAVWWISSVMRAEREHCCDDAVVAAQGDAFGYASALAALEERRAVDPQAVLASTGGNLVSRIRRLLAPPEGPRAGLTPILSAVILAITLAGVMAAWPARPAATPTPAPFAIPRPAPVQTIPSPLPTHLDARPILFAQADPPARPQEQTNSSGLQGVYRKWLNEDVAYIITDQERARYKSLQTDQEREAFIEQFWTIRDPTPGTPENEFKMEHYRRIAYANEHFSSERSSGGIPGWKTDRGRIYITFGPPDEIDSHASGEPAANPPKAPFDLWRYRFIEGIGQNVIIEFVDQERNGEYRMTADPDTMRRLNAAPPDFERLAAAGGTNPAPTPQGGGRSMRGSASGAVTRLGSQVTAVGANGVQLTVPLQRFGGHPVDIYVHITTSDGDPVHNFEETATNQLTFSRFLAMNPGSYRVQIVTKDTTNGDTFNERLPLEVK